MFEITAEHITAAKNKDARTVELLISVMKPAIKGESRDAAFVRGEFNAEDAADYEQEATVSLWLAIPRFTGTTAGEFISFAKLTIRGVINNARVGQNKGGLGARTMGYFEKAVRHCDGDVFAAEKAAQTAECLGDHRMTAETALEARLAYKGTLSADVSATYFKGGSAEVFKGSSETRTHAAEMRSTVGIPDAAYTDTPSRHCFADAGKVHHTLDKLSGLRRWVLSSATGVRGASDFGVSLTSKTHSATGRMYLMASLDNRNAMAEERDLNPKAITQAWNKGRDQFKDMWTEQYGARVETPLSHGSVSPEEKALITAVAENDEGIRMVFQGPNEIEFIVINDEGDAVCTWIARSRAVQLGLITV